MSFWKSPGGREGEREEGERGRVERESELGFIERGGVDRECPSGSHLGGERERGREGYRGRV